MSVNGAVFVAAFCQRRIKIASRIRDPVFTIDREDKRQKKTVRQYFDYWCDICSIPMYEIKRCECCQGPIRMRFQPRGLPSYIRTDAKPKAKPPASPNRDASP